MAGKLQVGFMHVFMTRNTIKSFHCAELTLINKGTQTVTIEGHFPLATNESITYPCYFPEEVNETVYNINFANDLQPGCLLVAICKNFLDKK